MIDSVSKALFHSFARSRRLKSLASRYGLRHPDSFARRFIAGETVDDAIAVARGVEAAGMTHTLDYLGESGASMAEADQATRACLRIMESIAAAGIGRNVSVNLTQLGLMVDRATSVDNLRRILDGATTHDFFVRVNMENSPFTAVTLDIVETRWQQEYRNVGIVLQSYLRRSADDAKRMNQLGVRVRLCKGAYKESRTIAHQSRTDVDTAFVAIMKILLTDGVYPAIATHDPAMIRATLAFAESRGLPADRWEFQMLYGIRRDLQSALVAAGYRVRIYIPFGREWFPYFMRRLGERPANAAFVLKSLVRER
jgi:proline dehydrogenase